MTTPVASFDTVKVTVAPSVAVVAVPGSGYFINLGDGRGFIPVDLWINSLPTA